MFFDIRISNDVLQQQLAVKDNQIDQLTTMLKASHEQQSTLVTALSAAQEASHRDKKRKGFFSRIFGKN